MNKINCNCTRVRLSIPFFQIAFSVKKAYEIRMRIKCRAINERKFLSRYCTSLIQIHIHSVTFSYTSMHPPSRFLPLERRIFHFFFFSNSLPSSSERLNKRGTPTSTPLRRGRRGSQREKEKGD